MGLGLFGGGNTNKQYTSTQTNNTLNQETITTNKVEQSDPRNVKELVDATENIFSESQAFLGETFATALQFIDADSQKDNEILAASIDKDIRQSSFGKDEDAPGWSNLTVSEKWLVGLLAAGAFTIGIVTLRK